MSPHNGGIGLDQCRCVVHTHHSARSLMRKHSGAVSAHSALSALSSRIRQTLWIMLWMSAPLGISSSSSGRKIYHFVMNTEVAGRMSCMMRSWNQPYKRPKLWWACGILSGFCWNRLHLHFHLHFHLHCIDKACKLRKWAPDILSKVNNQHWVTDCISLLSLHHKLPIFDREFISDER